MRSKVSIQQILQNEYYNQPNKTYVLGTHVGYSYYMNEYSYIQPEYNFTHKTQDKDSHRYLLDRLEEEGVFGSLPVGYHSVLDADNSFTSRYRDNTLFFYSNSTSLYFRSVIGLPTWRQASLCEPQHGFVRFGFMDRDGV